MLKQRLLLYASEAVFQDDLVNDLPTNDASPPEEMLAVSIELFKNHDPFASMASHDTLLLVGTDSWTHFMPFPAGEMFFPQHIGSHRHRIVRLILLKQEEE